MNVPLLLFGLTVSALLYVFTHKWKNKRLYKTLEAFPSPPTLPFIGNVHMVFGNANGRVRKFLHIYDRYTSPIVIWLSYLPFLVLTKLEDIQVVSNKCVDRDALGLLKESVGDGIIIARAEKWKKTRRLINPAFSPMMLQQYLIVFNQQVEILVEKLKKQANTGKMFDVWQYMANANIDIITENITGSKLKTQDNLGSEFSDALIKSLKMESVRLLLPWLISPFLFYLYRLLTGNRKLFDTLHKLPTQVLKAKKREYHLQKIKFQSGNEPQPKTLIDILLRVHETNPIFTEKQIHDEMLNIIVTGSESTAVMGSFALLMLAIYQDVQKKAYDEVRQVIGRNSRNLEMEDILELKYLDQCIKETLRMFTLFPITLRKTTEQVTLNDGRVIPKSCQVAMALHAIHRDPTFYPNPKQWNPENFAPEKVECRHKDSFLAFGLGPRGCIGSKYAMISMKTQVAHILYHYHVTTDIRFEDIIPTMDAIVRSKYGYPIKLTSRIS